MTELELLGLTAYHLVLTALPGVAAALFAARRGVREVAVLLAIALAASGVVAILAFWAYYAEPIIGETWAFLVVFGSVALIAASLWRSSLPSGLLRRLATPLALWALGTLFLVFLGFLHGQGDSAIVMAGTRFSGQLPSDNDIPHFFAEWFYAHGHSGTVPLYPPDWLFSDRPPLQVGYVLTQRNFGWDPISGRNYELLCVGLQQFWIIGLWALLSAARVGRVTRALAMLTVLVSDIAIVNGFFVWPKMLPAAMVLAAAALVLTPLWSSSVRRDWRYGVLIAVLLALAMLGHGSSIFALIPMVIVAAFRGLPSWRWIAIAIAAGLVLTVPWSVYQKYGDPPGNRLTKWMLAGITEDSGEFVETGGAGPSIVGNVEHLSNTEGTTEAIVNAYRRVGLGGALHNKAENFVTMSGGAPAVDEIGDAFGALGEGHFGTAIGHVRGVFFYNLLPSMGLLLLAPLIMLFGRRRRERSPPEWNLALLCYFVFAVGAVAWGLLLFGTLPARTIIHSGTYVIPILGLCGSVVGLRAVYPRFATWYVAIAATLMFLVFVPSLTPPPETSYSALGGVLCAICLAGFGWVAFREKTAPGEAKPVALEPPAVLAA